MTDYQEILYTITNRVATITFNRPGKMNSWTVTMMREMMNALDEAERDEEVRAVVFTGAGEKAFSSGFDLSPTAVRDPAGLKFEEKNVVQHRNSMQGPLDLALRIWDLPKPTIAAVNGYCFAVATEVMQLCDIVIAARNAVFGEPEVRHHSGPAVMTTPWILGIHKAKEYLLTGDSISADQAVELGLANKMVESEDLMAEAQRMGERFALVPPLAMAINKKAINRVWELHGLRQSLETTADLIAMVHGSALDTPEWQALKKIQREGGSKAYIVARDKPFTENAKREAQLRESG